MPEKKYNCIHIINFKKLIILEEKYNQNYYNK